MINLSKIEKLTALILLVFGASAPFVMAFFSQHFVPRSEWKEQQAIVSADLDKRKVELKEGLAIVQVALEKRQLESDALAKDNVTAHAGLSAKLFEMDKNIAVMAKGFENWQRQADQPRKN